MKKLMFGLILAVLVSPAAFAHPPADVDISVAANGKVQVVVMHYIGNPKEHYIYKIEVSVNGKKVDEKTFTLQVGNLQVGAFKIDGLKVGDKISATAYSNKGGEGTGEMTIMPPEKDIVR